MKDMMEMFAIWIRHTNLSESQTHHHTDASNCLGNGSEPVRQVVSDGAAHHSSVRWEAVDELAGSSPVKKSHFLCKDGGEDWGTEIPNNLLT